MGGLTPETLEIAKLLAEASSLTFSILALIVVWKAKDDLEKKKDEIIAEKDKLMQENREEVLQVVKDNTKTQSELRSSIRESTKATETLTTQLYRLFDNRGKEN